MSDPEVACKEKYLKFEWKDERWQTYYNGLYPPPRTAAILTKYKKKWYKNNVDSNLDLLWDPDTQPVRKNVNPPGFAGFYRQKAGSGYNRDGISISPSDASFLFYAYLALIAGGVLTMVIFSKRDLFFLGQISICMMDISTHFGFKWNKGYFANILADESGHLLSMIFAYFFIRDVPLVSSFVLYPLLATNLMAAGHLAKSYSLPRVPSALSSRIRSFGDDARKFPLLQVRANTEIGITFLLVALYITKFFVPAVASMAADVSIFAVFFNINLVYTRYTVDPFTQSALRRVEQFIMRIIGGTPLEKPYKALKTAASNGLSKLIG